MRLTMLFSFLLWGTTSTLAQEPEQPNNAFYNTRKIAVLFTNSQDSVQIREAIKTLLSYYITPEGNIDPIVFEEVAEPVRKKLEHYFLDGYSNGKKNLCELLPKYLDAKTNERVIEINSLCNLSSAKTTEIFSLRIEIARFSKKFYEDSSLVESIKDSLALMQLEIPETDKLESLQASLQSLIDSLDNNLVTYLTEIEQKTRLISEKIETKKAHDKEIISLARNSRDLLQRIMGKEFSHELIQIGSLKGPEKMTLLPPPSTVSQQLLGAAPAKASASMVNFQMPTQSEMIDALAIYISRRFKQEVAITLIDQLRKTLNRQELLSDLFPKTLAQFNNLEHYELPTFSSLWQHTISQDFIQLPENIKKSRYIRNTVAGIDSNAVFNLFGDMVTISTWVMQKNSVPEIVSLYKSDDKEIRSPMMRNCLDVMHLMNQEMSADAKTSQYWINWNNISNMGAHEFQLFLALVKRNHQELFKNFRIQLPRPTDPAYPQVREKFRSYFTKALVTLNNFQKNQQHYLDLLSTNPQAVYSGMNFWDFQQTLFTILLNEEFFGGSSQLQKPVNIIKKTSTIYKLMEEKNYAAMIYEATTILEDLLPRNNTKWNELIIKSWKLDKRKFRELAPTVTSSLRQLDQTILNDIRLLYRKLEADSANKKHLPDSTRQRLESLLVQLPSYKMVAQMINDEVNGSLYKELLVLDSEKELKEFFMRMVEDTMLLKFGTLPQEQKSRFTYITKTAQFLSDVMSANGSQQLSNVIEAYAMPPNSYKIKRNSRFSVDLNAYVGAYGGAEYLPMTKADGKYRDSASWGGVYGLSVPVGISFSWSFWRTAKTSSANIYYKKGKFREPKGNSFSLDLTFIDIAAVVSYRLAKGENAALPEKLKWSQILSPGIHARWGLFNTPLCISTGIQYTPQLRNLDEKDVSRQQAVRAYLGLFFDMPLFNIYRR